MLIAFIPENPVDAEKSTLKPRKSCLGRLPLENGQCPRRSPSCATDRWQRDQPGSPPVYAGYVLVEIFPDGREQPCATVGVGPQSPNLHDDNVCYRRQAGTVQSLGRKVWPRYDRRGPIWPWGIVDGVGFAIGRNRP